MATTAYMRVFLGMSELIHFLLQAFFFFGLVENIQPLASSPSPSPPITQVFLRCQAGEMQRTCCRFVFFDAHVSLMMTIDDDTIL